MLGEQQQHYAKGGGGVEQSDDPQDGEGAGHSAILWLHPSWTKQGRCRPVLSVGQAEHHGYCQGDRRPRMRIRDQIGAILTLQAGACTQACASFTKRHTIWCIAQNLAKNFCYAVSI
jgi:hypothetical protein